MRHLLNWCVTCILCLLLCFVFTACKSAEASMVDELILEIGTVTLDSEDAIETAEIHYLSLTEKQKEEVAYYAVLLQAHRDFNHLWEEEQARMKAEAEEKLEQQALERSKQILSEIHSAYSSIDGYAKSFVNIWLYYMDNAYTLATDISGNSIKQLAKYLDTPEEDIRDAMSFSLWRWSGTANPDTYFKSPEESHDVENELRALVQSDDMVKKYFPVMDYRGATGATAASMIVESIYIKDGVFSEIDNNLLLIENKLIEIKNDTPDYVHYETLKKCYNTLSSFYKFTQDVRGNYDAVSAKLLEYRTEIQEYIDVLEYDLTN